MIQNARTQTGGFKTWMRVVAIIVLVIFAPQQIAWAIDYDWRTLWNMTTMQNQAAGRSQAAVIPYAALKAAGFEKQIAFNIKESLESLLRSNAESVQFTDNIVVQRALTEPMTKEGIDSIYSQLVDAKNNIITCGAYSLYNLLVAYGKTSTNREGEEQGPSILDITNTLILIDLLSDSDFKPHFRSNELEVSFHSVIKTAQVYGVELKAFHLATYEKDLESLHELVSFPFIATIDEPHTVLVVDISEKGVLIIDNDRELLLSKENFIDRFRGYCLAREVSDTKEIERISLDQAKSIAISRYQTNNDRKKKYRRQWNQGAITSMGISLGTAILGAGMSAAGRAMQPAAKTTEEIATSTQVTGAGMQQGGQAVENVGNAMIYKGNTIMGNVIKSNGISMQATGSAIQNTGNIIQGAQATGSFLERAGNAMISSGNTMSGSVVRSIGLGSQKFAASVASSAGVITPASGFVATLGQGLSAVGNRMINSLGAGGGTASEAARTAMIFVNNLGPGPLAELYERMGLNPEVWTAATLAVANAGLNSVGTGSSTGQIVYDIIDSGVTAAGREMFVQHILEKKGIKPNTEAAANAFWTEYLAGVAFDAGVGGLKETVKHNGNPLYLASALPIIGPAIYGNSEPYALDIMAAQGSEEKWAALTEKLQGTKPTRDGDKYSSEYHRLVSTYSKFGNPNATAEWRSLKPGAGAGLVNLFWEPGSEGNPAQGIFNKIGRGMRGSSDASVGTGPGTIIADPTSGARRVPKSGSPLDAAIEQFGSETSRGKGKSGGSLDLSTPQSTKKPRVYSARKAADLPSLYDLETSSPSSSSAPDISAPALNREGVSGGASAGASILSPMGASAAAVAGAVGGAIVGSNLSASSNDLLLEPSEHRVVDLDRDAAIENAFSKALSMAMSPMGASAAGAIIGREVGKAATKSIANIGNETRTPPVDFNKLGNDLGKTLSRAMGPAGMVMGLSISSAMEQKFKIDAVAQARGTFGQKVHDARIAVTEYLTKMIESGDVTPKTAMALRGIGHLIEVASSAGFNLARLVPGVDKWLSGKTDKLLVSQGYDPSSVSEELKVQMGGALFSGGLVAPDSTMFRELRTGVLGLGDRDLLPAWAGDMEQWGASANAMDIYYPDRFGSSLSGELGNDLLHTDAQVERWTYYRDSNWKPYEEKGDYRGLMVEQIDLLTNPKRLAERNELIDMGVYAVRIYDPKSGDSLHFRLKGTRDLASGEELAFLDSSAATGHNYTFFGKYQYLGKDAPYMKFVSSTWNADSGNTYSVSEDVLKYVFQGKIANGIGVVDASPIIRTMSYQGKDIPMPTPAAMVGIDGMTYESGPGVFITNGSFGSAHTASGVKGKKQKKLDLDSHRTLFDYSNPANSNLIVGNTIDGDAYLALPGVSEEATGSLPITTRARISIEKVTGSPLVAATGQMEFRIGGADWSKPGKKQEVIVSDINWGPGSQVAFGNRGTIGKTNADYNKNVMIQGKAYWGQGIKFGRQIQNDGSVTVGITPLDSAAKTFSISEVRLIDIIKAQNELLTSELPENTLDAIASGTSLTGWQGDSWVVHDSEPTLTQKIFNIATSRGAEPRLIDSASPKGTLGSISGATGNLIDINDLMFSTNEKMFVHGDVRPEPNFDASAEPTIHESINNRYTFSQRSPDSFIYNAKALAGSGGIQLPINMRVDRDSGVDGVQSAQLDNSYLYRNAEAHWKGSGAQEFSPYLQSSSDGNLNGYNYIKVNDNQVVSFDEFGSAKDVVQGYRAFSGRELGVQLHSQDGTRAITRLQSVEWGADGKFVPGSLSGLNDISFSPGQWKSAQGSITDGELRIREVKRAPFVKPTGQTPMDLDQHAEYRDSLTGTSGVETRVKELPRGHLTTEVGVGNIADRQNFLSTLSSPFTGSLTADVRNTLIDNRSGTNLQYYDAFDLQGKIQTSTLSMQDTGSAYFDNSANLVYGTGQHSLDAVVPQGQYMAHDIGSSDFGGYYLKDMNFEFRKDPATDFYGIHATSATAAAGNRFDSTLGPTTTFSGLGIEDGKIALQDVVDVKSVKPTGQTPMDLEQHAEYKDLSTGTATETRVKELPRGHLTTEVGV
ncbi:hypothetical protein ACFL96_15165, partial [Thermoproteota archaeon]